MESDQEVVYRTNEDSHVVMSEKVQSLAGSIYQEFEKMIAKYGHDVVKDLMPLVVNVLECLDMSYTENQEHEVELELLREDNEQLVTQYEREKQLRKSTEQKLLEVEDAVEDERKDYSCKIESLESIVRMLELKAKNSSDHVFRLEEKESEMKKEYGKLHDRYTEMVKTHFDYIERTKLLMSSNDRIEQSSNRSSRLPACGGSQFHRCGSMAPFGYQSFEEVKDLNSPEELMPESPLDSTNSNTSLRNEMNECQDDNSEFTNKETNKPSETAWSSSPAVISKSNSQEGDGEEDVTTTVVTTPGGRSTTKREQRSGNTLYQELSFQDNEIATEVDESEDITGSWVHPGEYASSANDNFFGMGKEVENLIKENNELLATKNALNVVKDDLIAKVDELTGEQEILREEMKSLQAVKNKLQQKVSDLEEEIKRVKEEAAKQVKTNKSDEEVNDEELPMSQRKSFTRIEMARVLMERNEYKERFMELQEAVRWTEMIRASKSDVSMDKQKNRQTIWKYFSDLFRISGEKEMPRKHHAVTLLAAQHGQSQVTPANASARREALADKKRGVDIDGGNFSSEKFAQRRAIERKEQYRQVRAHVRKDDGRLQAYGWSLPAKVPPAPVQETGNRSHIPVPVPVYCQPLAMTDPGMKSKNFQIWCAAGVNLTGGKTKDGGSIVGASVFYSKPSTPEENPAPIIATEDSEPHITKLEEELKEGKKIREEGETLEQRLSSLVWICSSAINEGKVTVIDVVNPSEVLESFTACASRILCIASVPGAVESDYREENENNNNLVTESTDEEKSPSEGQENDENCNLGRIKIVNCENAKTKKDQEDTTKDNLSALEKNSSILPTMWLGAYNGELYIHSAVGNWSKCIHSVKMSDSVSCIVHLNGRVLVALANGLVAMFRRGPDAQWDMTQYHTVDLGGTQFSVRCMSVVHGTVWCGYKNKVHVLDPVTLVLKKSLEAHPRKESQVRHLAWVGDGVWVSIRLDSTLRLYHAHTYQHLQDVDIEPYVSKMLGTGKLGFSFVRITALLISTGRLWIGTGNGVIISVPLSENAVTSVSPGSVVRAPGAVVRVYTDATSDKVLPGSFIPYCSMAQAQLSFHGHRDSVKFFTAVPGAKPGVTNPNMLVMSGGEGYIDFRIGDGSEEESVNLIKEKSLNEESSEFDRERAKKGDLSHLIIWQVPLQT
ncbi:UNVERIFIED_CONTAM: hypothetical protein PYX00_001659 [Menopon gallinae]|uniref:JNK-interacting protein 3 n=1 Tax=Menopon gallinae TaxID=328185 RepID=A0AAW2IDL7_9NEOP